MGIEKEMCPVCGNKGLDEPPYDLNQNPSYEICFCCGYEFGFHDGSEGISHEKYREQWLASGAKWFFDNMKPDHWSLEQQLQRLDRS